MGTRREFLRKTFRYASVAGLALAPAFSFVRKALGAALRILPKGTKREDIVLENPALLDPRNLEITPLQDFGTMGLTDHKEDMAAWRLRITGQVDKPLSLTYEELVALPSVERNVLLICPGVFANYGQWKGVSISRLLRMAAAREKATHVTIRGPKSPYSKSQSYPIEHVLSDRVFLAYRVNGEPLPLRHGFPVRCVAEGYYGYDWIKFVYEVTVDAV